MAVRCDDIKSVRLLVNSNPSALNIFDFDGRTPTRHAVDDDLIEIVELLLDVYPGVLFEPDCEHGKNLLHVAKTKKMAKLLFKNEPTLIDGIDAHGDCVLHSCIRSTDRKLLPFLLKKKPSLLLHRNKNKETALHVASSKGYIHFVNHILTFDPSLVDTNANGNTVLHAAVKAGDANVIGLVFSNCIANLYCENKQQQTPLCLAIETNNRFAVQLFEPHLTLDMAIASRGQCLAKFLIDLQPRCLLKCAVLNIYLLPELASLVLQYAGIVESKKRKLEC